MVKGRLKIEMIGRTVEDRTVIKRGRKIQCARENLFTYRGPEVKRKKTKYIRRP